MRCVTDAYPCSVRVFQPVFSDREGCGFRVGLVAGFQGSGWDRGLGRVELVMSIRSSIHYTYVVSVGPGWMSTVDGGVMFDGGVEIVC